MPTQQGLFQYGETLRDGMDRLHLDGDFAVRIAHRRRDLLRAAHHHAFNDRLTAYHELAHTHVPFYVFAIPIDTK